MKLQFQALALLAVVAAGKQVLPLQDDVLAVVAPTNLVLAEAELVVRQVAPGADGSNNSTLVSTSIVLSSSELNTVLSTGASTSETATSATDQASKKVTTSTEVQASNAAAKTSSTSPAQSDDTTVLFESSANTATTVDRSNVNGDTTFFSAETTTIETTGTATTDDTNASSNPTTTRRRDASSLITSTVSEVFETRTIETTEATVSTIQTTNAQGQTVFYEKTVDVTHTLVVTKATGNPAGSLATSESSSSGEGGGLSTKSRNIIIGVVVGVFGGLIALGALYMAWKLYNNRRNGLSGASSFHMEKETESILSDETGHNSNRSGSADPFRQNLDQYHSGNSSKPVINTAANF
ncbi:hypothetical protein D0Z00_003542 [Geotrichum galactomycetum]|uniref:Uncharacterized protein n=1 Tax=Geotrichum galactomycetum TaxID=27317 RepID=A0ACB6V108_9ASCO|nr:hypothetical protein D0Z00_003542 [Geotrichum candidum]